MPIDLSDTKHVQQRLRVYLSLEAFEQAEIVGRLEAEVDNHNPTVWAAVLSGITAVYATFYVGLLSTGIIGDVLPAVLLPLLLLCLLLLLAWVPTVLQGRRAVAKFWLAAIGVLDAQPAPRRRFLTRCAGRD
jgi:ABC-type transport system involved in cytochrome bd biosynthesis fused ATPase/permease subunit